MSVGNLVEDVVDSIEQLKGLIYHGVCAGMTASTTTIIVPEFVNLGNDYFNTDWVMKILKNANSVGNAPEGEIRDITDYVSSSGRFTTSAFSQNVESNDIVIVAKRELFLVDALALKTTPITNSLAYRLSQFLASGDGDWATGQPLPSNTSLVDIAGDFTGPHNGAAQDDNIKASLDLAHVDVDAILADIGNASASTLGSLYAILGNPATNALVVVIGQLADAVIGMNVASDGTQTNIQLLRSILQRIGETPASPDDSLHTVVGQRDTAALDKNTNDDGTQAAIALLRSIIDRVGNVGTSDLDTLIDTLTTELAKVPKSDAAVSWNATALTAIEGEAEDALEGENLDHLLMLDGATNVYPEQCVADSILAKLIAKGDPATPSTYNCTTDSLEMLSDKLGAFSGDGGAAQDDSSKASLDLVHTEIAALPTDADVNAEVDAALNTIVPASPTAGSLNDILSKAAGGNTFVKATDSLEAIGEDTDIILADTNELQTDWVDGGRLDLLVDAIKAKTDVIVAGGATEVNVDAVETKVDTITTELAKIPKSDSTVSWNATALGAINAEVDTALNTIVPASPTVGSINDILSKAAGANTFDKATDSLESLGEDSDTILARTSYGTVVRKTVAFDGGAGNGAIGTVALFTVTGDVRVKLTAICSETLVGAATLECGVVGNTAGIIAQIADATTLIINEIWFDATPTTTLDDDSAIPRKVIAAGQDIILTIGAANITDGTIKFVVEYEALSTDGAVVAA